MDWEGVDDSSGFTFALKNEALVDVRPVRPNDGQTIQNGMYALSPKSRYFRFFSPINKLSTEQLHYFTDIDQHDHVAWIALAHDLADQPGVGIVRFIRFPDQPHIAEFAVTVIDAYQKQGLGTLLMAVLYLMARKCGIELLRAFVLPENRVAMTWLEHLGASAKFENDILQMDIPVYADLSISPMSPLLRHLRDCLPRMRPLCSRDRP